MCMWRPEVDGRPLPRSLSTLLFEIGSLTEPVFWLAIDSLGSSCLSTLQCWAYLCCVSCHTWLYLGAGDVKWTSRMRSKHLLTGHPSSPSLRFFLPLSCSNDFRTKPNPSCYIFQHVFPVTPSCNVLFNEADYWITDQPIRYGFLCLHEGNSLFEVFSVSSQFFVACGSHLLFLCMCHVC